MKMFHSLGVALFAVSMLGVSCLGLVSCTMAVASQKQQQVVDCGRAEKTMVALEQGNASAISDAFELMQCYDGSYADRVNVALGDFVLTHPEKIFSEMHLSHSSADSINGIVNSQPWNLVDHPCEFSELLNRRLKVIEKIKIYPRETKVAKSSLKRFMSIVSEDCRSNLKDSVGK